MNPTIALIIAAYLALINAATFVTFGVDKARSVKRRRRVPEAVLLQLTTMGGGLGALAGMAVFRHKTLKQPFQTRFWNAFLYPFLMAGVIGFIWLIARLD